MHQTLHMFRASWERNDRKSRLAVRDFGSEIFQEKYGNIWEKREEKEIISLTSGNHLEFPTFPEKMCEKSRRQKITYLADIQQYFAKTEKPPICCAILKKAEKSDQKSIKCKT